MHEMKTAPGDRAQSTDITGVLGDFRLVQNDIEHRPTECRRTPSVNANAIFRELLKRVSFLPIESFTDDFMENILPSDPSSENVVFLVDDWKEFTDLMSNLLNHGLGVKTHSFNDPFSALEALNKTTPRLIISDLLMPEMNGFEFLREAARRKPGIPSILVTGSPPDEATVAANVPDGFLAMLTKPISWRDIAELMRENRLVA
jgi:CheY-like chemotaxis protein